MTQPMDLQKLTAVANAMVAPGKGILAADESTGTIKQRFDSIGVESTAEESPGLSGDAHSDSRRIGICQWCHSI